MNTSIKYDTTDPNGVKSTKTLTSISPTATNARMKSLVQGLVALTGNSYVSAARVDTTDLNESDKPIPTITWPEGDTVTKAAVSQQLATGGVASFEFLLSQTVGSELVFPATTAKPSGAQSFGTCAEIEATSGTLLIFLDSNNLNNGGVIEITVPATATTGATSTTFTITEE